MMRLLTAAALAVTIAGPVAAQDAANVDAYVADFTRLCLDTGGEREAVRAAVTAAGWTPGTPPGSSPNAVDMAVWDAPDGAGQLMTSASPQGGMDDGLIVRTCILQPAIGAAPSRADLSGPLQAAVGHAPRPTAQGPVWLVSGTLAQGFVDESAVFATSATADEGFKLALERPLLMLSLVGGSRQSAAVLMRISVE